MCIYKNKWFQLVFLIVPFLVLQVSVRYMEPRSQAANVIFSIALVVLWVGVSIAVVCRLTETFGRIDINNFE